MTKPTTKDTGPGEGTAAAFAAIALDRTKDLHLRAHLLLLGMMELVRRSKSDAAIFDDLCAVANGLAELDHAFIRMEQELIACVPAGSRRELH